MKKILLTILSTVLLSSCGELTGKSTGANDVPSDNLLGGIAFIQLSSGKNLLNGTMNAGDAHSFRLNFNLPDGKSLRYFFFSQKSLDGGVILTFTRDGLDVGIEVSLNGISDFRVLKGLGEELDFRFEVHNDHEDAHLLMWNESGPFGDTDGCVNDESCLYNSEYYTFPNTDDGPWGSQGRAPGTFWGVQGDRSLILKLEGPLGALSDA